MILWTQPHPITHPIVCLNLSIYSVIQLVCTLPPRCLCGVWMTEASWEVSWQRLRWRYHLRAGPLPNSALFSLWVGPKLCSSSRRMERYIHFAAINESEVCVAYITFSRNSGFTILWISNCSMYTYEIHFVYTWSCMRSHFSRNSDFTILWITFATNM